MEFTTGPKTDIFQLPELLEAILLRLPPIQVITTCRLVCRNWKENIQTTPALRHYATTGLWIPDREHEVEQPLPDPASVFSPIALDILQLYWRRLDALALKKHDDDNASSFLIPSRRPLIDKISHLLETFTPICSRVQLLRPGFRFLKYKKFTKNWVAMVFAVGEDEVERLEDAIPDHHGNPLLNIMAQMGRSIWNVTKSEAYDYNPDGIVPRHTNGEIKAYLLFIVEYTAVNEMFEIAESKRKESHELLRQEDRKRVKKIIRDRSMTLVQQGFGPLDDDTEEDSWEEDERLSHAEYEKQVGQKVFRELLRFGDYEPHRPVVVIRGTNYGYT